ncbi:hypothetical protein [Lactobacillus selangorensis]|nr:hypothetical protein [Lactobacillus selangorensis]
MSQNTHKGVTGRRRPTSKINSEKRRRATDAVLDTLKKASQDEK